MDDEQAVMRKGRLFRLIAILLMGAYRSEAQEQPGPRATVEIQVLDPFGVTQPYQLTSFVSANSKRDYASNFTKLHGEMIPYGNYSFVLKRLDYPDVGEIDGTTAV
jgi:hypothetical protein